VTESDGTVRAYGYDGIDRLTSETVTGTLSYAKTFVYDPVGNRTSQTTTGAGVGSVSYSYDVRDRLTRENMTSYGYDPNGNLTSKLGEATYGWDFDNRLTEVNLTSGTIVAHQYDADGNRVQTSVVPPVAGGGPVACQGNSAVFVRKDTVPQGSWQGVYGADGQYIHAETPSPPAYGSVSFSNTSDFTWVANTDDVRALQEPPPQTLRIASTWYSATSETFHVVTTDSNEHTVAFYMLDWNNEGVSQTAAAQTPTGSVLDAARPFAGLTGGVYAVYRVCGSVDFVFAGPGSTHVQVSGVFFGPPSGAPTTTNLLVDTSGGLSQVVADTDEGGNLTALYVRNGDELLEVMRPGSTAGTWSTLFMHHDALGSVRALTDETGTTTDTRGYEAFGTKNAEAGSDSIAYGFAGEPFQQDSMLAYNRARWMDARVGRFEGMDPDDGRLLHPLSLHRYIYAAADPLDNVDPTGRDYDMASIGAGLEGSLVLSTLATVSFVAAAADIVCSVAENVSGVGIDPSKCPRIEYFNHYTDLEGYNTIRFFDEIWPPNGFVYLTKTRYLTADTAQAYLALPRPPVGFYAIPSTNLTFVQYLGPALPAFGQPGGGNEWFTYPPIPIANAIWTPIN
jgi:RHS repeat-associated protein